MEAEDDPLGGNVPAKGDRDDADPELSRWDWVTLAVALLIAALLAVVTFEVWISHDQLPHR